MEGGVELGELLCGVQKGIEGRRRRNPFLFSFLLLIYVFYFFLSFLSLFYFLSFLLFWVRNGRNWSCGGLLMAEKWGKQLGMWCGVWLCKEVEPMVFSG